MRQCSKCSAQTQPNGVRLLSCAGQCQVLYCSKKCQAKDWERHKLECQTYQSHICWICYQGGSRETPVFRACGCKGSNGFGHLQCFIDYAKGHYDAYEFCPICKQYFRSEIQAVLIREKEKAAAQGGNLGKELRPKYNMGHFYLTQSENEAAFQLFHEIMDAYRLHYGEQGMLIETLAAKAAFDLAAAACRTGRLEESLEFLTKLELFMNEQEVTWKDELEPAVIQRLSVVYDALGRLEEALLHGERSVSLQQCLQQQGQGDFRNCIASMNHLAYLYSESGDHEKAIAIGKKAYEMTEEALRPSHPLTQRMKLSMDDLEKWAEHPELSERRLVTNRQRKAVGKLDGLAKGRQLNGTIVEVMMYKRNKGRYAVRVRGTTDHDAGKEGRVVLIKPKNLIFDPGTSVFLHSLQQSRHYNGKEGIVRSFSRESGRFLVELDSGLHSVNVNPENMLAKYQGELEPELTYAQARMLTI